MKLSKGNEKKIEGLQMFRLLKRIRINHRCEIFYSEKKERIQNSNASVRKKWSWQ